MRYVCPGDPAREVVATFYPTDPETVVAERGAEVSVMVRAPAASGARYVGREASLWEHQSEAAIRWGHGQPERRCMRATAHSAEMPPVMLIACPVILAAAGEARKTASAASSSLATTPSAACFAALANIFPQNGSAMIFS